jgi:hypothetical protein
MVFINGKYAGHVIRFERWGGVHGFDVVFFPNPWGFPIAEATHCTNVSIVQPD